MNWKQSQSISIRAKISLTNILEDPTALSTNKKETFPFLHNSQNTPSPNVQHPTANSKYRNTSGSFREHQNLSQDQSSLDPARFLVFYHFQKPPAALSKSIEEQRYLAERDLVVNILLTTSYRLPINLAGNGLLETYPTTIFAFPTSRPYIAEPFTRCKRPAGRARDEAVGRRRKGATGSRARWKGA